MRTSVAPGLVNAAHAGAVGDAFDRFEPALAAACERILRRYTRHAVGVFTTRRGLTAAAGDFESPSWRVPLAGELIDQDAAQSDLEDAAADTREAATQSVGSGMSLALGLDFETTNGLLKGVIASQSGMHIVTAPQELVGTLMQSLQHSYDHGLSIPHAATAMRKAGYKHSQAWGARIARTELIGATNAASLALVQGGTDLKYKVWQATGDNRTRPTHRDADDQTVPVDSAFVVGGHYLQYPGDPSGPGDEVIQCRCTLGYTDAPILTTIAGGSMATTDTTEEAVGAAWQGPMAQEGVDTGDGRRIEPGALNWRALPLTLMAQHTTPDFGGHAEAQVSGRIDSLARSGENIDGSGVFDSGEWGAETERMVRSGMLKGVSIDLAINAAEIIPDPDVEDEIEAYFLGTLNILDGTILGATVVPFPAFENANIAIVAGACMRLGNARRELVDGDSKVVVSYYMPFAPALTASAHGPSIDLDASDVDPVREQFTLIEDAVDTLREMIAHLEYRGGVK